jgi:hypothetical protein
MAYDSYKDRNGVTWNVITMANGFTMIATVLDTADPKYDPPAEDLTATMASSVPPIVQGLGSSATAEQTRVLFTELVTKIEAWAKDHRGATSLMVTAKPPIPWWVWALGGAILLKYLQRR